MIRNLVFLAREWTLAPAGSALSADGRGHAPEGYSKFPLYPIFTILFVARLTYINT
jgi:hypothetical protein